MPGRLYFKIFLSFIAVLVVAMFLVAGLFRHSKGREFMDKFKQLARAQVIMVRTTVEDNIRVHDGFSPDLQNLVDKLGKAYMAKMWITDEAGTVRAQSFAGPVPSPKTEKWGDRDDHDDWDDYDHFKRWSRKTGATIVKYGDDPRYLYVTIEYKGKHPGTIHYLYEGLREKRDENGFFIGLAGIGIVVALLVMPVSWLITRRLNRLRESALRIGDGDLSHRADVRGKDEVAGVGRALNRMADSLSRMIRGGKELTANVSHEFRTPLTRIRIAEEMLREQFGDKGAAHLDSIREDIEALDKLIGKLLTLSKLDLKDAPLTLESVDLGELVGHLADRVAPIAEHRSVRLDTDLPGNMIIRADGEALLTGLGNILENGVHHADEGGTMSVRLERRGDMIAMIAENSHAPLPDEDLAAIFEPFRRAKGTTATGTGLGLAIAHKVMERHGGTLVAENVEGGIRFTAQLPVG